MTWGSARLSDGSVVSGEFDRVATAVEIDRDMQRAESEWVDDLRRRGVKAAHPDDGWVDRENDTVQLVYPQFNDRPSIGDRIALGWGWRPEEARVVEVSGVTRNLFGNVAYHFKATS